MLDRLAPHPGSTHAPKRVGRGPGSGLGKNSGRGEKGQGHRSAGRETPAWFEGGSVPLARRLPKGGFKPINRVSFQVVNVGSLAAFDEGATIDSAALAARGLIRHDRGGVKILGVGDAPKKLVIKVQRVSAGARKKIEDAGGSVELIK
jgi:large subunit ribosomal protein L15